MNSVIMSGEAEKYVRSKWERVLVCDGSYWHYVKGTILFNWANHCFHEFADWQAAYEFTIARERQIAEVEEEIAEVHFEADVYGARARQATGRETPRLRARAATWQRILAREQAALADLKRGMKEQP